VRYVHEQSGCIDNDSQHHVQAGCLPTVDLVQPVEVHGEDGDANKGSHLAGEVAEYKIGL
jgi:hypothetical protein